MILFLKDQASFPTAVVDFHTTNTSFLEIAEKYRMMGIKNFYFHLFTLQPELLGVNPHADNLTLEQKIKIGVECRYNPWYFFREVLRIPPQAGQWPVPFKANRGNIALYWLFFNHVDMALIQPRQTGKSVAADGLDIYILYIGAVNTRVNLLTKDNELRVSNVERLKAMRDLLPVYLNPTSKEDSDNKMELTCARLNNRLNTSVGQSSENAANNVGRGLTSPINLVDEGPFISFIDVIIPAMLSSGNAARDEAERSGALYGNVFTTTAGKKDSRSGRYMYEMIYSGMPWTEALFDMPNQMTLHSVVAKASGDGKKKPIVNITLSHIQLGYTNEWLERKMRESNSFGEAADRDYFNKWTSGGLQSPLSTDLNDLIRASQKDVSYTEITEDHYTIRWYIPKHQLESRMASGKFVMGMDTSDAVGRDAVTMVLQDVETMDVIMAANINEANLIRLSGFVADLMIRYPNIVLIPERRSSGQTLIDTLLLRLPAKGIDPFKRIFNVIVDESDVRKEDFREIQQDLSRRSQGYYDRMKKHFGFVTAGSGKFSRATLYSDGLLNAARLGGRSVNDGILIDEITGLMVKNGRIDHSDVGHDDMVVAWLLNFWFLSQAKNLRYYGIERTLNATVEYKEGQKAIVEIDPYDLMLQEEQILLRKQIEQMLEELRRADTEVAIMKLETRIRQLDKRLTEHYSATASIDTIMKEAAGQRSRRVRNGIRTRSTYDTTANQGIGGTQYRLRYHQAA